ncbi:helix-turn-helix domain-containing protein [Pelagibius marinus]|uniref:helix-turn-helix domain-containing protein n=1 Tax=Pelagibius marinus TaxID=2762760 RepID=UPI0029CA59FA|nr:helix-turn-helix transcriptional regulator [Pelagibius marinus]
MTEKPRLTSATPDPIDIAIGSRLRLRRLAMGFSQETLARALGITFQQIQKYERGTNRIFASRLFHLARTLHVPVGYFFEKIPAEGEAPTQESADRDRGAGSDDQVGALLGKSDTLKLIQAYNRISDPGVRRQIYALVRTVGDQDQIADIAS